MKKKDFHISSLVNMEDPHAVLDEVKTITFMMFPDFDFEPVKRVFDDVDRLFRGEYPGYRKCNTEYHDLRHTTDATIVTARLIHGAVLAGEPLSLENIRLGLIAALLHDTGYIQTEDDDTGTGAKHTLIHIKRSIKFAETYFAKTGFTKKQFKNCNDILNCTGLNTKIWQIKFASPEIEMLGKMLGSADLVGQIGDRTYLEKLLFLFYEFSEANMPGYEDELDLLKKTIGFYEFTKKRLEGELGGQTKYLRAHFKARFNIDKDLYEEAMEKNLQYLNHILKHYEKDYRSQLKRGEFVRKLLDKGL